MTRQSGPTECDAILSLLIKVADDTEVFPQVFPETNTGIIPEATITVRYRPLRSSAHLRSQQPVQHPISHNTNVLWNSLSLGKITAIGYPWFYKATPFLSFEGKNRVKLIYFFWYSPLFGMRQKTAKNQWNCIVLNFNQIKDSLFQYKFKSIFPTKST